MKQTVLISLATGLFSSIAASYTYAQLSKTPISGYAILVCAVVLSVAVLLFIRALPRIRLALASDILAFYPRGQKQYISKLLSDLHHSESLRVIGARGLDLIGERSPVGNKLATGWKGTVEAFLLDPRSSHARLRGNALSIEKDKYEFESRSVDTFLGVLALRNDVKVTVYNYDSPPLLRAFILDEYAYVAFYQEGVQGRMLPCYRIRILGGRLITELLSYCNYLKATSSERTFRAEVPNNSADRTSGTSKP